MQEQIQQVIDYSQEALTSMASQLGVALPELWGILIKQQYVEAVQSFVLFIGMVFIVYFVFKFKVFNKMNDYNLETFVVFGAVIYCFIFFFTILFLMSGIGKIINPEYYAIQDITVFISNMISK